VVVIAAMATTTCCGSAAAATLRGASLVAVTALLVIRGTLDERRLVGMDASAVSAFVGVRGWGTVGTTLRTRNQKD
jgi:hypothetical protein